MICNACGNDAEFVHLNQVEEKALYRNGEFVEVIDGDTKDSSPAFCHHCDSTDIVEPEATEGSGTPERLYAHSVNLQGNVVNEFDTRLRLYSTDEDLAELVKLCKRNHKEYQYLTHEILGSGRVLYRWNRRVHPEEEYYLSPPFKDGPFDDAELFLDWLRELSEPEVRSARSTRRPTGPK